MKQTFEDKLLAELKHHLPETPASVAAPRRRWKTPAALTVGVAAVLATAIAVVMPTVGGERSPSRAWAVTEDDDGTVTVAITQIEDAAGLERKIEEHGVNASVHYLPQDKLCAPPRALRHPRYPGRYAEGAEQFLPQARGAVRVAEREDGAFVFTIDRSRLKPEYWVVVYAENDVPEWGQQAETVPSIAAVVLKGDHDECELVPGSIEGWGFQQGAPKHATNEQKADAQRRRGLEEK